MHHTPGTAWQQHVRGLLSDLVARGCITHQWQLDSSMSNVMLLSASAAITLFPGSCAWAEKKEPGTHCLYMLSSPRICGYLEISRKTCSVTLITVRHTDFSRIKDACHWLHSMWTMMREWQRYSAFRLQELSTHLSISAKHFGTWLTQSFPSKFTNHPAWSNSDCYQWV